MHIKILDKIYKFCREKLDLKENKGYCTSPKLKNKKIVVDESLKDEEELDIILHECLHAAFWFLDEEYVAEASKDFARILWRLGYRKKDE